MHLSASLLHMFHVDVGLFHVEQIACELVI